MCTIACALLTTTLDVEVDVEVDDVTLAFVLVAVVAIWSVVTWPAGLEESS